MGAMVFLGTIALPGMAVGGRWFDLDPGLIVWLVLATLGGAVTAFLTFSRLKWAAMVCGALAGPWGFLATSFVSANNGVMEGPALTIGITVVSYVPMALLYLVVVKSYEHYVGHERD